MTQEMTLEVKESPVQFGGRAKVNSDIFEGLDIQEGDQVVVSSKNSDILVSLYSDNLIEKNFIKLRKNDMDKLTIREGDEVQVREHKSLLNTLL